MTKRKCYLTKRELEIVRRFKDGESVEFISQTVLDGDEIVWTPNMSEYSIEHIIRRALTHQRVTDHGKVYYDKPAPRRSK